jgi:23S rRNA A1618 N6-methylase RlmF
MGEFGDSWGDDFEAFKKSSAGKMQGARNFKSAVELRRSDKSKVILPPVSTVEEEFENEDEIKPEDKMSDHEKRYWKIRKRTKLPKEFRKMVKVNVSNR